MIPGGSPEYRAAGLPNDLKVIEAVEGMKNTCGETRDVMAGVGEGVISYEQMTRNLNQFWDQCRGTGAHVLRRAARRPGSGRNTAGEWGRLRADPPARAPRG